MRIAILYSFRKGVIFLVIENQGRSDNLIKSFAKGKRVGLKTRLEVILYSISPYFYRKLLDIKNSLEKVAVKKGLL